MQELFDEKSPNEQPRSKLRGIEHPTPVDAEPKLERKQNQRATYDRIVIVSEGSKTEPLYFKEIRAAHRLHAANVEVQPGELGTEPVQVVQYARDLFENGDAQ